MSETYTTIQGDTWDLIAYKVYGEESRMTDLIKANPSHVRTVIFSAGTTLKVPAVLKESGNDRPPWMVR